MARQIKKQKKYFRQIELIEKEFSLDRNLLKAIFIIESHYRNCLFRLFENVTVLFKMVMCFLFKLPIRNYTIGRCQIGLSSIMNMYGYEIYDHVRYINEIDIYISRKIIKAMFIKENLKIAANILDEYLKGFNEYVDEDNVILRIGELYNGAYVYGMLLLDVMKTLKMYNI